MCDFCKTIYTPREAMRWKEGWWECDSKQPYTIIVKYNDDFELWKAVDDNYYTGRVMDIKYCPLCGRQLIGVNNEKME